jgi:Raf kinase inhibitor-like YbhB/YbcL family protein
MKKIALIILSLVSSQVALAAGEFTVTSKNFKQGEALPKSMEFNSFGCDGGNLSPEISWVNAPEGTKSFAITVHDPDAPTTSGWWHWLVFNIPADVTSLEEGASVTAKNKLPAGALEAFTDYGSVGFGGACPPKGDKPHRYNFTLYALKVEKLDLDPKTTAGAKLTYMLNSNSLAKASLSGVYGR